MRKYRLILLPLILFSLIVLTTSCTQGASDSVSVSTLSAVAEDETQAAVISDMIDNELDTYVSDSTLSIYKDSVVSHAVTRVTAGPVITIDKPDTLYPKTFTLDYGSAGTTVANGNKLKGKIIVVVNKKMKLINSSRSVTLVGFSSNGTVYAGSKTVTYKGINASLFSYWNVSNKASITRVDGTSVVWNSERVREWVGNNNTPLVYSDDIYALSGSSTGTDSKGNAYNLVIRNNYPLVIWGHYPFYLAGLTSLSINNGTMVIDYGDGTVDKKTTTLVNGESGDYTFLY